MQTGWNGVLFSGQGFTLGAADDARAVSLAATGAVPKASGSAAALPVSPCPVSPGEESAGQESSAPPVEAEAAIDLQRRRETAASVIRAQPLPNLRAPDPPRWMRLIDPVANGILIGF